MNEIDKNAKLIIDVEKLFPEAARRVKILEEMQRTWASVVGLTLARNSSPAILGVNEIQITANNKRASDELHKMKGTIIRKIKKFYNYEVNDDFEVVVK